MNSILETGRNLPPGLWLPTHDEPTDQYKAENFAHARHDYEDIIDYGAFMVSLIAWEAENSGRISMMPTQKDLEELREEGYGLAPRTLHSAYGGMIRLQRNLGFFPMGYRPEPNELIERYEWITNHAFLIDNKPEDLNKMTVQDVIDWGTARDLSPNKRGVYEVLGDTALLRKSINMDRRVTRHMLSDQDMYRFGAQVIAEQGGPISAESLNQLYAGAFGISKTYEVIRNRFNTVGAFWLEFDYVYAAKGLTKDDVKDLGIRWQIQNGQTHFTPSMLAEMSRDKLFPSKQPVVRYFGTIPKYREAVNEGYKRYLSLESEFENQGVSNEVFKLACRKYEDTLGFADELRGKIAVLNKLSSHDLDYVLKIMKQGPDLEDETTFEYQIEDIQKLLIKVGVASSEDIRYALSLIPRLDVDSALKLPISS